MKRFTCKADVVQQADVKRRRMLGRLHFEAS
jgi:hypothetical protein